MVVVLVMVLVCVIYRMSIRMRTKFRIWAGIEVATNSIRDSASIGIGMSSMGFSNRVAPVAVAAARVAAVVAVVLSSSSSQWQ